MSRFGLFCYYLCTEYQIAPPEYGTGKYSQNMLQEKMCGNCSCKVMNKRDEA